MAVSINNKEDFHTKLTDAGNQLVIVDFYAKWCGSCNVLAPKLEEYAKQTPNILVLKVDVDEREDVAMEYNIASLPTVLFVKNKEVLGRFSGDDFDKLKTTLEQHLKETCAASD